MFLLSDADYFAIEEGSIGRTSSRILFYSILSAIICSVLVGFTYDLFGRKPLIMGSFVTLVILFVVLPSTSPSITALIVVRVLVQVGCHYLSNHPVGIDYVKADSRGKLVAYQGIGNIIGELFTFGVVIKVTANM